MVYPHAMLRLEYLYYSFDNNVALSGLNRRARVAPIARKMKRAFRCSLPVVTA